MTVNLISLETLQIHSYFHLIIIKKYLVSPMTVKIKL